MNCQVTEKLFHIISLLEDDQRRPKDYGTGQELYHSEVSFLEAVAKYPDANVSETARLLGITKGAVTQMYIKLEKKGLLFIHLDGGNRKEKYFSLTETGETVRAGHQAIHAQANARLCGYLSSLSSGELGVIQDFLGQLESCVPFCDFTCGCTNMMGETEEGCMG